MNMQTRVFLDTVEPMIPFLRMTKAAGARVPSQLRRFEILPSATARVQQYALGIVVPCVHCGRPIHPFRSRTKAMARGGPAGGIFLAATCRQEDSMGCSRGKAASRAMDALEARVLRRQRAASTSTEGGS